MKPLNENPISRFLLNPNESVIGSSMVLRGREVIASSSGWAHTVSATHVPIQFEGRILGHVLSTSTEEKTQPLGIMLAGVLNQKFDLQLKTLEWLGSLFEHLKGKRDWVGVYWMEGFLNQSSSTDLIVGPYLGPATPHTRIGADQGLCGLAFREGRTINVDDVRSDSQFLACSVTTRSEIVIPIRLKTGAIVGELDIDSNVQASFSAQDQTWLEAQVLNFGNHLEV